MRGRSVTTRLTWSIDEITRVSCPHRVRVHPDLRTPLPVRLWRDLARLDLAAAAPEDVGVTDGDADGSQMFVDGFLVGENAFLFHAVGDAHDVDVAELGAAFAPV